VKGLLEESLKAGQCGPEASVVEQLRRDNVEMAGALRLLQEEAKAK
jgi:hypothetical protein